MARYTSDGKTSTKTAESAQASPAGVRGDGMMITSNGKALADPISGGKRRDRNAV